MARRRLPRMVFDFCDGGAEDEITRGQNEAGFADWQFLPQPLAGSTVRDQSVELFGAPAGAAGDHRPDRALGHALAARRARRPRAPPMRPARSTR